MQFSKISLAAAALYSSIVYAQGQVKVHVVTVSGKTNTLTFSPNNLVAEVGDMVQFQFGVGNHTVTQSTFDAPCLPMGGAGTNTTAISTGFMPVAANATTAPLYTIPIVNKTPIWLYCAQGKHCQKAMVMVINENTAKNASRSLNAYIAGAAAAPVSVAPSGNTNTGTNAGSGNKSNTSSGSDSGSSTGTDTTTSGTNTTSSTGTSSGKGTSAGSVGAGSGVKNSTTIPGGGAGTLNAPYLAGLIALGAAMLL
ncbi:hypothetical protein VC83_02631 [Pseudogymnoascus destructans]|uniref:Phytocyanin domain-containing protein n=2 Tax=Pseudogymnoascus destructans TaxID=655981 RepID=L8FQY1_PSED2|nr:uncharacterized protein VC83_02631 [Pseudogymnoascus destructans]ELR02878.1 hypothetical protein GMDG_01100 [Pseudogymnoascus destructans 20631-21]OAF61027.1 hypothetical protein VC83_02631 [Pseudogymnoascus destructans]